MPTMYRPDKRPGLSSEHKEILHRLERKKVLSAFDSGRLRAFAKFGDLTDAERAQKLLRRFERQMTPPSSRSQALLPPISNRTRNPFH